MSHVGDRGDHLRRLAKGRHSRYRVDLDPDIGTVRAVDAGEHAAHGLQALDRRRHRVNGHRSVGGLEDEPVGVFGERPDELAAR